MRIHYLNTTHVARVAKSLRKSLEARQIDLPLSSCQETLARMVGYEDWQDLCRSVGTTELPSIPDELAPLAVQAARKRQYVTVLIGRGVPEPIAHAIVAELSPSARKLSEIPADAIILEHADLPPDIDLSPAAIAQHPGLLNLLRRTHHAVLSEPYWAELSSWRAFREIAPSAVEKVSALKGNIAHPGWGPALAAALADSDTPRTLRGPARDGDLSALSKALARLERREFMAVVANVTNRVGVKLLDAKPFFLGMPQFWSKHPWMPYEPRPNGPFGPSAWDDVDEGSFVAFGLHEHAIFEDGNLRIKASSDLEDPDVEDLLSLSGPSRAEVNRFMRRPGGRIVMLGEEDGSPIIGALVRRKANFEAGTYGVEFLGTFLDDDRDDGIPVGEWKKILAAALGIQIRDEIEENARGVRPGTTVRITFKDASKERQDAILATLVLGMRGLSEIARDEGEPVSGEVVSRLDVSTLFPSRVVSDRDREILEQLGRIEESSFYLHPGSSRPAAIVSSNSSIALWHDGNFHNWGAMPAGMRQRASIEVKKLSQYVRKLGRDLDLDDPCLVRLARGATFIMDIEDFYALQFGRTISLPIVLSEPGDLVQDVHEILFEFPTLADQEA